MNVLSLFDGISCGRIALERANIKVDKYYASEIDKYAIQVTQNNYPDTIQLGSVTEWKSWDINWSNIDLVSGGFPCQAWSIAGKQLGIRDPRGKLFWTMLDIMKNVLDYNPKAKFLIENVKMKKEFEQYITLHTEKSLGVVHKHLIDSSLVSAQRRKRYFWTNIKDIKQPEDKKIKYIDVLDDMEYRGIPKCMYKNFGMTKRIERLNWVLNEKANTLTTNRSHTTQYLLNKEKTLCRLMTRREWERLQTVPEGYTDCVPETQACKMLGNGWTVDVIAHIFKGLK